MKYRTKERKIEDAAELVRQAAAKVAVAHHKSEKASDALYEAKNEHNLQLKSYRALVSKIAYQEGNDAGRGEGRRQLLAEQKKASK
jgi:hypothetical protein